MVETRNIEQTLIHKLIMNPMMGNTESSTLIAWSDDRDKLINWYNDQFADEPYCTVGENSFPAKGDFPAQYSGQHKYYKVFKIGSLLEWYNPIDGFEETNHHGQGIQIEWVDTYNLVHIGKFHFRI
jgi:hypothetical protein